MRKILSLLLSICLFFSLDVFSAEYLTAEIFGKKTNNPELMLPISSDRYIKYGYTVIEAEDIVIDKGNISTVVDSSASGGKVICNVAEQYSPDARTVEVPSLGTKIYAEDPGAYNLWMYVYSAKDYNRSIFVSPDGGDSYNLFTTYTYGKWIWLNCGIISLEKGENSIYFKRRDKQFVADKIIITSDGSFSPIESDDLPNPTKPINFSTLFTKPDVMPPSTHPRVHLTPDIINEIKANLAYEPMKQMYKNAKNEASKKLKCNLPASTGVTNYAANHLYRMRSMAFLYAIGELDTEEAYVLIGALKDYLNTFVCSTAVANVQDDYIAPVLETSAMVYDWCYDLLTESDKEFFISKMLKNMRLCGYPFMPDESKGVAGKSGEDRFMRGIFSASVAIYDEYPEAYYCTAGLIYKNYIKARKFYYQSGKYPVGNSYSVRIKNDFLVALMYNRWGIKDIFGEDIASVARTWLHEQQPDGYLFKYDDDTMYSYKSSYANTKYLNLPMMLASAYSSNPYVTGQWAKVYNQYGITSSLDEIWLLLYGRANWETKNPDDLPLVRYTGYPLTSLSTRTSWQYGMDAPNAMVNMNMKSIQLGDHSHLDVGSFQIFYKGGLAIDSGIYQGADTSWGSNYDFNYHKRTTAHNAITVYDPNEKPTNYYGTLTSSNVVLNDGGQKSVTNLSVATYNEMYNSKLCTEKAHYIGPNETTPHFAYIKGDLTNSYTDKVTKHERSFVYMDLFNNNYPMALVVFDKLNVKDASFKKSFLLHSEEKPQIDEKNGIVKITKTKNPGDNGKLVNKTILPALNDTVFDLIGGEGKEYYVNGQNIPANSKPQSVDYELSGDWRVELSPRKESKENYFMNAMYVMDANSELPELKVISESNGNYVGVTIRDRMALVSKNDELTDDSFSVTVRDNGFNTTYCFITDIKEGCWEITGNNYSKVVEVKNGENTLFFEAPCGQYNIKPVSNIEIQETVYPQQEKEKPGDFFVLYNGLYMYLPKPTKLINGECFIPVKLVLEHLDAKVEWDSESNSVVITGSKGSQRISENNLVAELNGEQINMRNAPFSENGVLYANVKDFEEVLQKYFIYDDFSKMVTIINYDDPKMLAKKYSINIQEVDKNTLYVPISIKTLGSDGANVGDNVFDFDEETRWSCEAVDKNGAWLIMDFGKQIEFNKMYMAFYNGASRRTVFDLEYSLDGKTYTKFYSGTSKGGTNALEIYDFNNITARFIRFVGFGVYNDENKWCSVTEMYVAKEDKSE